MKKTKQLNVITLILEQEWKWNKKQLNVITLIKDEKSNPKWTVLNKEKIQEA